MTGDGWLRSALGYLDELGAIALGVAGLLTLLGLPGLTRGSLIDAWVKMLQFGLGWGAYVIGVGSLAAAYILSRDRRLRSDVPGWSRVVASELLLFSLLALFAILDGMDLSQAEIGAGGGVIGWSIATILGDMFGTLGRLLCLLISIGLSGYFSFRGLALLPRERREWRAGSRVEAAPWRSQEEETTAKRSAPEAARDRTKKRSTRLPREFRKAFQVPDHGVDTGPRSTKRDPGLPPFEILAKGGSIRVTSREINRAAGLIEKTLSDFGLPVKVVDFRAGPAVTQFAVEPGFIEQESPDGSTRKHKVRVSQISALANDLALALSASALRIEAPVPGKAFIGIEVPNKQAAVVRLRPILASGAVQAVGSPLAIALGRDVAGAPITADLAMMPHLLIAGTTGSGKSVCIAALATCLAMNNHPRDLRMVMIDPKMVELLRFNGLPHLLGKVETELERIIGVLRWCTVEMDRRYKLLEAARARDLSAYHRKIRRSRTAEKLPRLVVMIDELADLMMMAPDQTEGSLVRLAQMARATGIHLVVATQRPSTDILTGLIKANFSSRIAFAVASNVDSRVILDGPGAETLLGRGDMLFLPQEAGAPLRLQGIFVDDQEITKLVDEWKQRIEGEDEPSQEPPWESFLARQAELDGRDNILEQAIELVTRTGQASASLLQRRLKIGYPRAARIMDELEELGVIGGPQSGGRTREVLRTDPSKLAGEQEYD